MSWVGLSNVSGESCRCHDWVSLMSQVGPDDVPSRSR
jgi:hypothetical protein